MKILRETKFPARGWYAPGSIVLRDSGEKHVHRYVTHWRNDETGGYCHGNYFGNLTEAKADYAVRVSREEKLQKAD